MMTAIPSSTSASPGRSTSLPGTFPGERRDSAPSARNARLLFRAGVDLCRFLDRRFDLDLRALHLRQYAGSTTLQNPLIIRIYELLNRAGIVETRRFLQRLLAAGI